MTMIVSTTASTITPPRVDVADLERRATDPPATVCHLLPAATATHALCGRPALFVSAADVHALVALEADPGSSPCVCDKARCASCAAEYSMRRAHG
jgi:hypothetical protein